jgi:hypothetical protein
LATGGGTGTGERPLTGERRPPGPGDLLLEGDRGAVKVAEEEEEGTDEEGIEGGGGGGDAF